MMYQRGMTIVSLMVGITISLIVTVAMMSIYKNTIQLTTHSSEDSKTDSNRTASFLTSQNLLQAAGFGIDGATFGTDLVVIQGAVLTDNQLTGTAVGSTVEGNAIVWGTRVAGAYRCTGLFAPAAGGLTLLAEQDCTNASTWNTLTWSTQVLHTDSASKKSDGSSIDDAIKFTATSAACQPFGISATSTGIGTGGLKVKFSSQNSNNQEAASTSCLANFPAP